jgi:glycosyltransferase involved in cell wall biosynthesis
MAEKIEILGIVDDEKKLELLAGSEVLALTSRREGFPRIAAEAMASGLPVVTAQYMENGAKEVVKEYGIGEVTEPTADSISHGMLRVLEKWDSYSKACLAATKSLDWEIVADELLKVAAKINRSE